MSMQVIYSSKLSKFLVDPEAKLWQHNFIIDPILSPLSDDIVSGALGIERADITKWADYGLICKTCEITVDGNGSIVYSNYWDIMQASIAFSLLEVNISIRESIDFAVFFCDSLSYLYEKLPDIQPLGLTNVVKLAQVELERSSLHLEPVIKKHGIQSIAIKIAIDLLNTNANFLGHLHKSPHPPAPRYGETLNRQWGCSDGADGFFQSFGSLYEPECQEGSSS